MVASYSSKRISDAARNAGWNALPAAQFAALGVTRSQVSALQAGLVGHVIMKGDPGYDAARQIFNPIFDRYPGAIVFCQTEADVALALEFGQLVPGGFTVRSGGHSTAGYSTCDGVLIDVSALNDVSVDTGTYRVTVGPGCNFGKLYQVLETYGLHVPAGECPDVCVGGFVQGGGYGFTSVSYGLNCDNAVSFRVMLADGSIIWATPQTNADLFWALCGGTGGNFGVILSVTYALRALGNVTGWALAWPLTTPAAIADAAAAMMVLQASYMLKSICGPDMNMQVSLCFQNWIDPTKPAPPPNTPLEPYFMVRGMWLGPPASLPPLLAPLTKLPGCIPQWTQTGTFRKLNDQLLNFPQSMPMLDQMPFEDKVSRYIDKDLTLADWTQLLTLFAGAPNNMAYGYAEFYGGAINQVPTLGSAFVHRSSALNMVMDVYWLLNADRANCEAFLDSWIAALDPMSNGETYQNYPRAADPGYIDRYWGPAYPVLQLVKAKYDPGNAFAFPQQIWAVPTQSGWPKLPAGLPATVAAALAQPVVPLVAARSG
jgi:FAD binding domain/Berberine and berberine like